MESEKEQRDVEINCSASSKGASPATWKRRLGVAFIAFQFSLDSSVYLSSIVPLISGIVDPGRESYWVFVTQAVLAGVETAVSFVIGWIAYRIGTIKWLLVALVVSSAGGNFLYSCAGPGALNRIGAVVGGRALCGLASCSAALVYSYITSIVSEPEEILTLTKTFRTSAGLMMALGQIIAVGASRCNFYIGRYHINNSNAPTFLTSFLILVVAGVLSFILENPDPKQAEMTNPFHTIRHLFRQYNDVSSIVLLLWVMMVSAYSVSVVGYFVPVFLGAKLSWKTDIQATSFIIGIVVSIIASILFPKVFAFLSKTKGESNKQKEPNLVSETASESHLSHLTQSAIALFFGLGFMLMIVGGEQFSLGLLNRTKAGIIFVAGMTFVLTGYNVMSAAMPVIFSLHLSKNARVHLMPIIGAMVGLGKLLAPIISNALYQSNAGIGMAIGFGIILAFLSIISLNVVAWNYRRGK